MSSGGEDDELVAQAKQGDSLAWRRLYERHAGRLLIWLHTLPTGDPAATPDDLAAEAWLIAARRIGRFHGTHDEFAGWLFGIAHNLARNARRRTRRRSAIDLATSRGVVTDTEVDIERLAQITTVLCALPRREREAVVCVDVLGLEVAVAALTLGLSENALRVARSRGLARLRRDEADVRAGLSR